jgi:hypothetical protein
MRARAPPPSIPNGAFTRGATRVARVQLELEWMNPRQAGLIPPAASIRQRMPLSRPQRRGQEDLRARNKAHLAILLGIGLLQIGPNRVQISNSLCRSDPSLEMPITAPTHRFPRSFRTFQPSTCSWLTIGTKKSGKKINTVPRNPGGVTPRIVGLWI